jgi:glycyl-tRNA synthetase beta chain
MRGLTARSKDVHEEIKGPSTKAPEQAVLGRLHAQGGILAISPKPMCTRIRRRAISTSPFISHRAPGPCRRRDHRRCDARHHPRLLLAQIHALGPGFGAAWGAEMGAAAAIDHLHLRSGNRRAEVIAFAIDDLVAGNTTSGHRFHAPDSFTVRRFDDYAEKLERARVVLDAERRKEIILSDARNLAFASGLELVEDEALLDEVSGLVEWPVVLMGEFEEDFLQSPTTSSG